MQPLPSQVKNEIENNIVPSGTGNFQQQEFDEQSLKLTQMDI